MHHSDYCLHSPKTSYLFPKFWLFVWLLDLTTWSSIEHYPGNLAYMWVFSLILMGVKRSIIPSYSPVNPFLLNFTVIQHSYSTIKNEITYFYLINTLNAKIIWFKIKTINWTANLFNLTAIILLENTISITTEVLKFNM